MYFEVAKEKFEYLKQHYKEMDVFVLAIESSCDETSIAVIKNGTEILSNIISSQIDIHTKFGGVVPEIASRNHLMAINGVLNEALQKANITLDKINAIAVTYGAGLVGALMVGVTFAKSLAFALEIPLIKVNHIKGHVSANYLCEKDLKPPFISLIVSGGHTAIVKTISKTENVLIGTTLDDAIGEAYDKVAKVLGLGYPGGPKIDKLSAEGENNIMFMKNDALKKSFNFSFSGIKTAVINYIHSCEQGKKEYNKADVACSFQTQAIGTIIDKTIKACKKYKIKTVAVAGGVAANSYLRKNLLNACEKEKITCYFPPIILCTDNAAMIGAEAYNLITSGEGLADLSLTATPNLNLKYTIKKN